MDRTKEYTKRKAQRLERRERGLCTRCGVPLDISKDKGRFTCGRCRESYRYIYYPVSSRALSYKRNIWERGQYGDCWLCGKKLPEGYEKKNCPECIEKSRLGRLISREKKTKID